MEARRVCLTTLLISSILSVAVRADIVINEIMYHPESNDRDATYVELYNTSPSAVNLLNWQFNNGIAFTFPNVSIPGNDYLVVCKNEARVQQVYGATKTIGDFTGFLSRDGERITLVDQNSVVVDTVSYNDRIPWPLRADGEGAAVGLINPALENDDGDHWEAEMVVNRDGWRQITMRGVFDPLGPIKVYLELSGEAWIDDVVLARESQPAVNLLTNPGFESGSTGWSFVGNHAGSAVETGAQHSGSSALHVRSTGQGSFGSNYVQASATVTPAPTNREFFILSLWLKPLDETNGITMGSGNGDQGTLNEVFHCSLSEPEYIPGTPGAQNHVFRPLPQPIIDNHNRIPDYPTPGQTARVEVAVENPAQVASMQLRYAVQTLPLGGTAPDPLALSWSTLPMTATGSTFTATIPGQAGGRLVRYYIEMTSSNGGYVTRRPEANDVREYYGYYVPDTALPAHKVPMFYVQINPRRRALVDEMADDIGGGMFKGYNLNVKADLVDLKAGEYFGDIRTRWRGGVGTRRRKNNIKIFFNDGYRWDGLRVINMTPNNQGRAVTTLGLANAVIHEMERRFGFPSLDFAQWARVYYHGDDRGLLTMVEQPDRNFLERFGLSRDGQMFKSIGWRLAYPRIRGDEGTFYGSINDGQDGANKLRDSINNTYTLDEYMHLAYDQELSNEIGYSDLLSFVQTINDIPVSYPITTANPSYVWFENDCATPNALTNAMQTYLESTCNVDFMFRKWALDIIGADTDRVIHNHFWYQGLDGKWFLLSWDRDFWSRGNDQGIALFMQVARWYKPGSFYPNTWRLPVNVHTGSWPTFTVMLWPPAFRQQYYGIVREAYETVITPFSMKNYTDKQVAYVQPEHALAGYTPALDLNEFQAQQNFINSQRVEVFQFMQSVFDMDPALMTPLVCDLRHTPPVPSPGATIQFQAHAVSSTGASGVCNDAALMLKGPGDTNFVARTMSLYAPGVPDSGHTYYYNAPGLQDGEVYDYYVIVRDTGPSGQRTTTWPRGGAAEAKRVMCDGNPAVSGQGIVINEIMYNSDLEANEYIELTNRTGRIVDLSGWYLIDTSTKRAYVFENDTTLAPWNYLVAAGNAWRLKQIYGIPNVVGDFAFRLDNAGDSVLLYNNSDVLVDRVDYSDLAPWPTVADGQGPALELLHPSFDNNDPLSWGMAFPAGHRGTPGRRNFGVSSGVANWKDY